MAFSPQIKEQILVESARHCCVCHKPKGLKVEVHHIIPQEKGGKDVYENAIALCFDCHADAGHYYAKHPKGLKLSPSELKKHKDSWLEIVRKNNIESPTGLLIELIATNKEATFEPEFIEKIIKYHDRHKFKDLLKRLKFDVRKTLEQTKTGNFYIDSLSDNIKSFDDYIDFLNGDLFKDFEENSSKKELNIQPKTYSLGTRSNGFGLTQVETYNLSICTLNLRLINNGPNVLEDFKIYLDFENIIKAQTVNKSKEFLDLHKYVYNVFFTDDRKAEFIPNESILVQDDSLDLDPICFLTDHIETEVIINWRIVARDFSMSDRIKLHVKPKIATLEFDKYVENPADYEPITEIQYKYK